MSSAGPRLRAGLPPASVQVALGLFLFVRSDFELWHVGVFYRDETGGLLRLLEMKADLQLIDRAACDENGEFDGWAWVELPLDAIKVSMLANLCRAVRRALSSQPWVRLAFAYFGGYFDPASGRLIPASGEIGLNCATCVLALCHGIGVDILDEGSWQITDAMTREIDWFIRGLWEAQELFHAPKVEAEKPCVVYHPLDLAAACYQGKRVDFATASSLRGAINAEYRGLFAGVD